MKHPYRGRAHSGDALDKLLGGLERDVMKIMWARGESSVRQVLGALNAQRPAERQLAYTTVMTVMSRLADKGVLRRVKQGRGYVYEPVADDPAGLAVRGVMRDFGDAAMAHFVEEARADPDVLRRLQTLLEGER